MIGFIPSPDLYDKPKLVFVVTFAFTPISPTALKLTTLANSKFILNPAGILIFTFPNDFLFDAFAVAESISLNSPFSFSSKYNSLKKLNSYLSLYDLLADATKSTVNDVLTSTAKAKLVIPPLSDAFKLVVKLILSDIVNSESTVLVDLCILSNFATTGIDTIMDVLFLVKFGLKVIPL